MTPDDSMLFRGVGDPEVSPNGERVAYTVSSVDKSADKHVTQIWAVNWDGSNDIQLTRGSVSSNSPRWSPNGKYLAFLSSRPGKATGTQVWLLDLNNGGEARQLTSVKGGLNGFIWSPDSKHLLLTIRGEDNPDLATKGAKDCHCNAQSAKRTPKPIVIDRYHFKEDYVGYLTGNDRNMLYLYDISSGKLDKLTSDRFDESNPAWSPDGQHIAYVSIHAKDPDRTDNTDVFVVDASPNSSPRQLTNFIGPDGGQLSWSPDSTAIAYIEGGIPKYEVYNEDRLGVVSINGSVPRILTTKLDRTVSNPIFSSDGKDITVLVTDDRVEYPAAISVHDGSVKRLTTAQGVASRQNTAAGHDALLWTTDAAPAEIFALDSGTLRKLSGQNDALLAQLKLGRVHDIDFHSKDGTPVHGFLTVPPNYKEGSKYPTLLRIHGGPTGQDDHSFSVENQIFAAHGYAVINVNYRGGSGRGEAYARAIAADWGDKEVADLLAGVDYVVSQGVADPNRLGVGGWSYGGMLTDYTIASTTRFKAAIAGAGMGNPLGIYGVDEYVFQYDNELGPPWKNTLQWIKISYPFLHADRIHTPTLFMGGTKDFNVPLVGGEQMYEALKSLNVPAELVIYPGQFHGIDRPSFILDRYQRYLAWYDKYLMPKPEQK